MSDEVTPTVEIAERETPKTVEKPSIDDVKAMGWSEHEIESAEKRGMIKKEKKEEKGPENNGTSPDKPEDLNRKAEVVEEKKEEKPKNTLPDFSMTPEQEKVFLQTFGPGTPQHGTYLRMKSERRSRQAAEAENKELKARLEILESKITQPKTVEVDESGQEIDPDDKPMTPKMFREMMAKEAEEAQKKEQEKSERAMRVAETVKDQEDYAKSIYPDYDDTVKMAREVLQNLDTLVPEKWKQDKIKRLYQDLHKAAATADQIEIDGYTPALIGYEIGSFHPNYKKPNGHSAEPHNDGKKDPTKANGSLTPEQLAMKRAENNTQRKASSASVPGGGGKITLSVDDVTMADINKMDAKERLQFREKYPERYAKILRG